MDYQLMPDLPDEDYQNLKDDIEKNGVLVPIEFDSENNCLDGHNRLKICEELGIKDYPKVVRAGLDCDRADELAVTLNVKRRQLSHEEKIEIAQKLKMRHSEWPVSKIASLVGVNNLDLSGQLTQSSQLTTVEGTDGKKYPSTNEQAQQQREEIRQTISNHPDWSDRKVANEVGVSHVTVGTQRKKLFSTVELSSEDKDNSSNSHSLFTNVESDDAVNDDNASKLSFSDKQKSNSFVSVFNPSSRDEKALKDPDIVERLSVDNKLNVAGAIREQKRDRLVEHLESVEAREAKAVEGVYDVIVIDPPWPIEKIERNERPNQSEMDYPIMSIDEIKELEIPSADTCHVFLWTTQKYLRTAFEVFDVWGVNHCWTFVWHKDNGYKPYGLPMSNGEFILYGHIGNPKFIDETNFWTVFNAPTRGHSVKPEEFYNTICRVTAGRRLDMFGRRKINGFDSWGKEAVN